jgi:pimeloyl-ACP methyl ester carboxylesterase
MILCVTRHEPPPLDGVEHRYVTTREGVRIHVACAGPDSGRPIMLVHGFPQHWWAWRHQIGPLAADGCRVLAPDLRGAGWSDAPRGPYLKTDMAEDLAAVLDQLDVGPVTIAAHDWGGPVALLLLLRHAGRVTGIAGFNTVGPWLRADGPLLAHLWAFYYQYPLLLPGIGPRVIGDPRQRYLRWLTRWLGGGFQPSEVDLRLYLDRMGDPARAYAGSQWYRTFPREAVSWLRGAYADSRVDVPLRWVTGLKDPVITPVLHDNYREHATDITFEHVPDAGHWIHEQAPELVLDRIRALLADSDRR